MAKKTRSVIIDDDAEPRAQGRPRKMPLAIGGNVTDDTIKEFIGKVQAKKAALDEAKLVVKNRGADLRAMLKTAGKVGVDPDAINWYLAAEAMEPVHLERIIAWRNRVAKVMALPMGTQLGWDMLSGATVAEVEVEVAPRRRNGNGEGDPRAAYVHGYDLAKAGETRRKLAGLTGKARIEALKGYEEGLKERADAGATPE